MPCRFWRCAVPPEAKKRRKTKNTNINICIYFFLLYEVELEELGLVNNEVLRLEDLVKPTELHANGAVVQAILLQ